MKYVLFVCNHNAGRSQMAAALFERHAPDDVRAESAGSTPEREIWPGVIEAMNEIGIDLSGRRPRKLLPEMQLHADWAVTLACGEECPYVPTIVEDWDIPDPAGLPVDDVRPIRDEIERRVKHLIETRLDEIRTNDTAHQFRLRRILPDLIEEFGAIRAPDEIRACADALLSDFDEGVVRTYIPALVTRQARECLRQEECSRLAGVA